jgi:hypothetical protein
VSDFHHQHVSMKARRTTICYLCGHPLPGIRSSEDGDHVPPEQLLVKSTLIRGINNHLLHDL